jgi:hypothetical protein
LQSLLKKCNLPLVFLKKSKPLRGPLVYEKLDTTLVDKKAEIDKILKPNLM